MYETDCLLTLQKKVSIKTTIDHEWQYAGDQCTKHKRQHYLCDAENLCDTFVWQRYICDAHNKPVWRGADLRRMHLIPIG